LVGTRITAAVAILQKAFPETRKFLGNYLAR
jgi:hypothetical protein